MTVRRSSNHVELETGDLEIGAVELKNASTDDRASIQAANTARTTGTIVVATQNVDASGNVMGITAANTARTTATKVLPVQNIGANGLVLNSYAEDAAHASGDTGIQVLAKRTDVPACSAGTTEDYTTINTDSKGNVYVNPNIPVEANYFSPIDGTVVYTSNVTITCSGFPFTVADANCYVSFIDYYPTGSTFARRLVNGVGGVSLKASANVITVAGAGTPFAASDTYFVGIRYQDKNHTVATSSSRSEEIDPISRHYVNESLVDTTNVSAATHYYPASTGFSMDGYKDVSWSGKFIDADGTVTMTVEAMNDEDTTSGDWIDITKSIYDEENNSTGNSSFTITNGTLTFALSADNSNWRYMRLTVVFSGATNTAIIKMRRKAL